MAHNPPVSRRWYLFVQYMYFQEQHPTIYYRLQHRYCEVEGSNPTVCNNMKQTQTKIWFWSTEVSRRFASGRAGTIAGCDRWPHFALCSRNSNNSANCGLMKKKKKAARVFFTTAWNSCCSRVARTLSREGWGGVPWLGPDTEVVTRFAWPGGGPGSNHGVSGYICLDCDM